MKQRKTTQAPQPHNIWPGAILILIVLAVVVIALMFIAWAMPSATNTILGRRLTSTPVAVIGDGTTTLSPTVATEPVNLAEPAEVGYGDGIIIASGVLLLILLAATFREIVIYNRLTRTISEHDDEPSKEEPQND